MTNDPAPAAKIDRLLTDLLRTSGLDLTWKPIPAPPDSLVSLEFSGADSPMLIARNAELLLALEHIAAKTLRLESDQHDLVRFESGGFKARRERNLHRAAEEAVRQVRATGKPFAFPPMSSHERRLLHLALAPAGLHTESTGEGPHRHLVLHPRKA